MGMAASQARYLGLTARKTNVEYEGQQVNQARTALANQSANLFNQLLTLQVPVPPNTTDFTKVQYSYVAGTTEETIESMSPIQDPNYNYNVTHFHYADVYKGQQYKISNPQVQTTIIEGTSNPTYQVGNNVMARVQDLTSTSKDYKTIKAALDQIKKDQPDSLVAKCYTDTTAIENNTDIYYYTSNGRTYFGVGYGDGATPPATPVEGSLQWSIDSQSSSQTPLENQDPFMASYAETTSEKVRLTEKAMVEIGPDGRASSIKYENDSQVYTLDAETITDEKAYADAMNQYTYDMATYEKQIQDINAKTEAIQAEDRTLELRLKQLDTEQEALQTEMEAVKKVIDKNIEMTFKTFE